MADSLPTGRAYRRAAFLIALLPIACLAGRWSRLPARVPIHFGSSGADVYGDKRVLLLVVLVPLLLYYALPLAYQKPRHSLMMSVVILLSLLISGLVLWQ